MIVMRSYQERSSKPSVRVTAINKYCVLKIWWELQATCNVVSRCKQLHSNFVQLLCYCAEVAALKNVSTFEWLSMCCTIEDKVKAVSKF